jgi:hypothetical protein
VRPAGGGEGRPVRARLEVTAGILGLGDDVHEAVPEQPAAADDHLRVARNLDGPVNLQLHRHTAGMRQHLRRIRHRADRGAGKQDFGILEQAARVGQLDGHVVRRFEPGAKAPELHDHVADHSQPDQDEEADPELERGGAFGRGHEGRAVPVTAAGWPAVNVRRTADLAIPFCRPVDRVVPLRWRPGWRSRLVDRALRAIDLPSR